MGGLRDRLVDDVNCVWRWVTTWLNLIGTTLLTYALANQTVVAQLLPFLPDKLKPYAPLLGILWGVFVQGARMWKQKQPAPRV
jgi:hypothetical protein